MEEKTIFKHKRLLPDKLFLYGFVKTAGTYHFSTSILDGQFRLFVTIFEDGNIDTMIIDTASNEEYVLHRVSGAVGLFTGSIRAAYETAMLDIAEKCFETDTFKSVQTRQVITYARYLW